MNLILISKKQIFVNYGNCLDTLGRGVESLNAYDNAIRIDKIFSMAIRNKAKSLLFLPIFRDNTEERFILKHIKQ